MEQPPTNPPERYFIQIGGPNMFWFEIVLWMLSFALLIVIFFLIEDR